MSSPTTERRSAVTDVSHRGQMGGDGATRHDKVRLVAFVHDADTENVLRLGLNEVLPEGGAFHRGGVQEAAKLLQKSATPQTLIVDIGKEREPLAALARLAEVVEPSVQVLVIGNKSDLNFYREVTRSLGAQEYLARPLTPDAVRRHFAPLFSEHQTKTGTPNVTGGQVVAVTGAHGGVGTTTIAANLAWYFSQRAARHTALLDPDLHFGSAAMLLDSPTGPGLAIALQTPDRVDPLFIERSAHPLSERLHVLAGEVRLQDKLQFAENCIANLFDAMRQRYALVVADTPRMPHPLFLDIFEQAHKRVVVMVPTLACVRDIRRLLAIPPGPGQTGRPVVVLNRFDLRGGLSRQQVEQALGFAVDIVIPDLPRLVENAATMGEAMVDGRNAFARAIATLARHTAYTQLIDSPLDPNASEARKPWWRR